MNGCAFGVQLRVQRPALPHGRVVQTHPGPGTGRRRLRCTDQRRVLHTAIRVVRGRVSEENVETLTLRVARGVGAATADDAQLQQCRNNRPLCALRGRHNAGLGQLQLEGITSLPHGRDRIAGRLGQAFRDESRDVLIVRLRQVERRGARRRNQRGQRRLDGAA